MIKNTRLRKIAYLFSCLVFLCINLTGCGNYVIEDLKNGDFTKAMIEIIEGEPWESAQERIEKDQTIIRNSVDSNEETLLNEEEKEPQKGQESSIDKEAEPKEENEDLKADFSDFSREALDAIRAKIDEEDNYNFYYHQLSYEDKDLYAQLYKIITELNSNVKLITNNADKVDEVFLCVISDHPELFYITGYSMNKYMIGHSIDYLEFSGTYTRTKEEIEQDLEKINDYSSECLALVGNGDDYSKVKYIYEYIIKNTEYDINSVDNQNILSVFLNGRSVCQGYAKASQYLLDIADIPCILVSGTVNNGESHAWNMVKADGKWYYLDTTWGDASYSGSADVKVPEVSYDYLCTNSYWMNKTHHVKTKYRLPEANSLDDFYYVKEGTYFTWYDEDKLKNLIVEYTNSGKSELTIKCEGAECYHEIIHELFDNERAFDLFYGKTNLHYVRMDDQFSITFYLV